MLFVILTSLLYSSGSCYVIPIISPTYNDELIKCITEIVKEYLATHKVLTYVGNKQEDGEMLEAIHALNIVAMMSKRSSQKLIVPHQGYLISANNYTILNYRLPLLLKESTWNPEARFLIIVRSLKDVQLKHIFDSLLKQHITNVVIVNASSDAHLYSYNPFDNYGCGKRYDDIISYGKCSQLSSAQNLFPNKYVTGIKNCTFTVAVPHLPPYAIIPQNGTDESLPLAYGIEPYFLRLIGEMKEFTINIILNENDESFATVSSDMEADGSLKMLQDSKVDVVLGGQLLVPSRGAAFNYVYDLLPYVDEIRFLVRQARLMPLWKNFYLEFDGTVWLLIVLSLMIYSVVMIILLRAEDKSHVVLQLLDILMQHGSKIHSQSSVKCIFIIWVWCAYIINTCYQSSLVSLTADPARQKQISTEADILDNKLKPCFSEVMQRYYIETTESDISHTSVPGCKGPIESIKKLLDYPEYYTIYMYGLFQYNRQDFFDVYGHAHIYALKKPYSKVIYCMYFYKGFPFIHEITVSAIKLREIGLVDKAMSDMNYLKVITHHFHAKEYKPRFALPWYVYVIGCTIAAIAFVVEILSKHK